MKYKYSWGKTNDLFINMKELHQFTLPIGVEALMFSPSSFLLSFSTKLGNPTTTDVEWRSTYVFLEYNFTNDYSFFSRFSFFTYVLGGGLGQLLYILETNGDSNVLSSIAHATKNQLIHRLPLEKYINIEG
jgi:hypothetical protein